MDQKPVPALTPRAEADRKARIDREAKALRDNLRRRKTQQRPPDAAPDAGAPSHAPDAPADSLTDGSLPQARPPG